MSIWNNAVFTWRDIRKRCFTKELKQYQKVKNLEKRINILHWVLLSLGFSFVFLPMIYLMYSVFILHAPNLYIHLPQIFGMMLLGINHFQLKYGIKKLDELKISYRRDNLHNIEIKDEV